MIEKLKSKDLEEAAEVYIKGLSMEKPEGYATLKETVNKLRKINCLVHKSKNEIDGLVTFKEDKNSITIDFICSLRLRKGIGKKLMKELISYSKRNKINIICSTVSSKDKRVIKFYDSLGFKKYGKYHKNKLLLYKIKLNL
ncbi:MAG TPA: GNAT family N-acetyltransferase [Candidatus Nanoarchaeia archaeon]|nr:GNAT family N-acetyltransferase [Candidatus Nanoarchaeia archaeon]